MTVYCPRCRKCACKKCHPVTCVDRNRRIFLLGVLAAPLVARLPTPAPTVTEEFINLHMTVEQWTAMVQQCRWRPPLMIVSPEVYIQYIAALDGPEAPP